MTPPSASASGRRFTKMHGLGNDFVVIDARGGALSLDAATARLIADRRRGVGCDQLILIEPARSLNETVHDIGTAWLALAVAGLSFRVLQLWLQDGLFTGIVWLSKILTDPFHDVMLYWRSPLALLRGELFDPMTHVRH